MVLIKGGYIEKLARIELTKQKVKVENISPAFAVRYIGGSGWGARLVWDEIPAHIDPVGPENKLLIAAGPFNGIAFPTAGKTNFSAISPLTGIYGDTNMGGHFSVELKQAGFDCLILEGAAEKPVYIWVEDGEVEIREAKDYWGMGSFEFQEAVRKDLGDQNIRVAHIGPAGENLVKFACITTEWGRNAGRCGLGCVMGSKKVKGVAVRGSFDVPVADLDGLMEVFNEFWEKSMRWDGLRWMQRYGMGGLIEPMFNVRGILGTRYFTEGVYNYAEALGEAGVDRDKVADTACTACPFCCGYFSVIRTGPHKGISVDGPEFETKCCVGSNCGISTHEDIIYASYLIDNFGMDSVSTGIAIGFAMECYEKGLITKKQLDGLDLKFGNSGAIFEFIEMIANRKGIGNLFAEGVKKASEKIGKGSEKFAMHVKGNETTAYGAVLRCAPALALAFATSDIGGHHKRACPDEYDFEVGMDTYTRDKVELTIHRQHLRLIFDCLGVCRFSWLFMFSGPEMTEWPKNKFLGLEYYTRAYEAVTGVKITLNEWFKYLEGIWNLTRAVDAREGITSKDDWLPDRVFDEPFPKGPKKGITLDRTKFRHLLQQYYQLRGWSKDGIPTR
ncbi:MAG: aldehyde ferredoxin oxidoreductase family protein, partial [Candidatus Hodarchaeota archaeon]